MLFNCQIKDDNFSFRIVEKGEDFNSKDIFKNKLFAQSNFLRSSIEINRHIEHRIVEITQKNKILGHLYFQVMPFNGSELSSYVPQHESCIVSKTLQTIFDLALERVNWKLVVLGNIYITGDNGQYWQCALDSYIKWKLIREAANFLTTSMKLDAFLVSDLTKEDIEGKEKLIEKKYRLLEVEPDLVFDIDPNWRSFDDYLSSINSKYRVRTKKVLKTSKEIEIKELSLSDLKENSALLFQLYKNVVDSAAFKLARVSPNYFHDFKQAFPDKFHVKAYYIDKVIRGFMCYFIDEKTVHINFVGLDYDFNKKYSVYHRVLYDCIEQGILLKKQKIHFGRTASEIKTSVGAKPIKAYSFIKHNKRISNIAIKPLTNFMKPEPFEVRNPFGKK